jgi:hypothetical protein
LEKPGTKKQTVTVTFRLNKEIIDALYDESDSNSISLNSLVNHILKRYLNWDKYEDKSTMIHIVSPVVKDLFIDLDKEKVIRLAKDKAKDPVYNLILFMNGKVDFDTLISWYKQRMRFCSEISEKKEGALIQIAIAKLFSNMTLVKIGLCITRLY